jgi:hypothetical protein
MRLRSDIDSEDLIQSVPGLPKPGVCRAIGISLRVMQFKRTDTTSSVESDLTLD